LKAAPIIGKPEMKWVCVHIADPIPAGVKREDKYFREVISEAHFKANMPLLESVGISASLSADYKSDEKR
jgi:hypothetical protein